jgi:opacity protein-like surface antigen
MKTTIRAAAVMAAALLLATAAEAQVRPAISVTPAAPARWDVSGNVAWFGSDKSDIAPQWDRWYDVPAVTVSVGHYWTPHLKAEISATASRAGRIYVSEPIAIRGQSLPAFRSSEHIFQATTVNAGVAYQFFENQWFHPFVGAGLELVREKQRVDVIQQIIPALAPAPPLIIPPSRGRDEVHYAAWPFVDAGFKWYVSEQAFVRTDLLASISGHGPGHVVWANGFGVEF